MRIVGNFAAGDLSGWESKSFHGQTEYTVVELGNRQVLKAHSQAAASGLFKKLSIDLKQTPYLNWSWRVENTLRGLDETTRAGDDYPARLYVIVSGGLFFWNTRALNYVWSGNQPEGTAWPNAYTSNSIMVAVQSGGRETGTWVYNKRNLRQDLRRYFGKEIDTIDAIAIMTDTDNSHQSATAYYGNIFFASE